MSSNAKRIISFVAIWAVSVLILLIAVPSLHQSDRTADATLQPHSHEVEREDLLRLTGVTEDKLNPELTALEEKVASAQQRGQHIELIASLLELATFKYERGMSSDAAHICRKVHALVVGRVEMSETQRRSLLRQLADLHVAHGGNLEALWVLRSVVDGLQRSNLSPDGEASDHYTDELARTLVDMALLSSDRASRDGFDLEAASNFFDAAMKLATKSTNQALHSYVFDAAETFAKEESPKSVEKVRQARAAVWMTANQTQNGGPVNISHVNYTATVSSPVRDSGATITPEQRREPQLVGPMSQVFFVSEEELDQCAWHPTDDVLAQISGDKGEHILSLWDTRTGRRRARVLLDPTAQPRKLFYTPDGKYLVTGDRDGTIHFTDIESQTSFALDGKHADAIRHLAISADGKTIVSTDDNALFLWNVEERRKSSTLTLQTGTVHGISVSADGSLGVTAHDGQLICWDLVNSTKLRSLLPPKDSSKAIHTARISLDNKWVVAIHEGRIEKWETANGRHIASVDPQPPKMLFNYLALSPDGRLLAAAPDYVKNHRVEEIKRPSVFDLSTLRETHKLNMDFVEEQIDALHFRSDDTLQTVRSPRIRPPFARLLELWQLADDQTSTVETEANASVNPLRSDPRFDLDLSQNGKLPHPMRSVAISPDGRWITASGLAPTDLDSGERLRTTSLRHPVFVGDDKLVDADAGLVVGQIAVIQKGTKKRGLWTVTDIIHSKLLVPERQAMQLVDIADIKVFKGSDLVVTRDVTNNVKLWSLRASRLVGELSEEALCVELSPGGKYVVTGGTEGGLRLWTTTGKLVRKLNGPSARIYALGFPTKNVLATWSANGFEFWNIRKDGMVKTTGSGPSGAVHAFAFSDDGKAMVVGFGRSSAELWDWRDGVATASLAGHTARVGAVAFSPDGQFIATAGDDGKIKVWNYEPK